MRNSLETTTCVLNEFVDLRVEYNYHADNDIDIDAVEIFRHAREIFCGWERGQWVRVDISAILSTAQISYIRKQITSHEAEIAKWALEYAK